MNQKFFCCPACGYRTKLSFLLSAHIKNSPLRHRKKAQFALRNKS